jgi:hypothetical protein
VITPDDIPMTVVRNYRFLRIFSLPFDPPPLNAEELAIAEPLLRARLGDQQTLICQAAWDLESSTGIAAPRLMRACYWLVAQHRWLVDFHQPIGPDHPLFFKS